MPAVTLTFCSVEGSTSNPCTLPLLLVLLVLLVLLLVVVLLVVLLLLVLLVVLVLLLLVVLVLLLVLLLELVLLDDEAPPCPPQAQGPRPVPSGLHTWTPEASPPGHAQLTWAPGVHVCPPPAPVLEDVVVWEGLVPQLAAPTSTIDKSPNHLRWRMC
jgi:hypothetical protein